MADTRCMLSVVLLRGLLLFLFSTPIDSRRTFNRIQSDSGSRPPQANISPSADGASRRACEEGSCYPATGDLLIGRASQLKASSTCGLRGPERYCLVGYLEDGRGSNCFICDSRDEAGWRNSHRIDQIISTFRWDWRMRWWQAETGKQDVSLRLDLEAEFHLTHVILQFKTFRPAAMLIERSRDFGRTWKVYRYFAQDCAESFPTVSPGPVTSLDDVICDARYSDVEPTTEGEVIFQVLPASIQIDDPYDERVQDLMTVTNLRINFTQLHTLGDNLLENLPSPGSSGRASSAEKYYYALYRGVVRGSCSCYGHASRCVPLRYSDEVPRHEVSVSESPDNMVHGMCECMHHTRGLNCELCEDFYNDLPWRPALKNLSNACKRCECNNHATRCHFDAAVYEATGRTSGGVCDECQHHTGGRQCQECLPYYYLTPQRTISDWDACQPCDCDPAGSEHGGECESVGDRTTGVEAGACLCKRFATGRRCDMCKQGYWNLNRDNEDGCQACYCDSIGSADGGRDCNPASGQCLCKRFVTGRQCNRCHNGYWNLSLLPQGCQRCDCVLGGAYGSGCDLFSGQCFCKPFLIGRTCDHVMQGYFLPSPDHLLFEAETGKLSEGVEPIIRDPQRESWTGWTGTGFVRAGERGSIEFDISGVPATMEYLLNIRYEQQELRGWDDVRVSIIAVNPSVFSNITKCDNSEYYLSTNLPQGERNHVVEQRFCLEGGATYRITLDFYTAQYGVRDSTPTILIDSIVLMPSTRDIEDLRMTEEGGRIIEDLEKMQCSRLYLTVPQSSHTNPQCDILLYSLAAAVYGRAIPCDCDLVGSESDLCDPEGGQCPCKRGVGGRKCDICLAGTYGLSVTGCKECDCKIAGALDNRCDPMSGQCSCRSSSVIGRRCDQCAENMYGYPNCRPCLCGERAESCDRESGHCVNCLHNTVGSLCDRCADGFYDSSQQTENGRDLQCKPCPCPGVAGVNHAHSCRMDPRNDDILCYCEQGYMGVSCDQCSENYYGNAVVGGCRRCECSGNIDTSVAGGCDQLTGRCLLCLYNTQGYQCELCRDGYYGDAKQQNCKECVCNVLGTNRTASSLDLNAPIRSSPGARRALTNCDRHTGQCPCMPNVVGLACDQCAPNHWRLASGRGCAPCGCDPTGALGMDCNQFDGQCRCRSDRGGRTCTECPLYHWGTPQRLCTPCDCEPAGTLESRCDISTGSCLCVEGVVGTRCDQCRRGFHGQVPQCQPCDQCYKSWDSIIRDVSDEVEQLLSTGVVDISELQVGGDGNKLQDLDKQLAEISKMINGDFSLEHRLVLSLVQDLKNLSFNLTSADVSLTDLRSGLNRSAERLIGAELALRDKQHRASDVVEQSGWLKGNATILAETSASGALLSTRLSAARSERSSSRIDNSSSTLMLDSELSRIGLGDMLNEQQDHRGLVDNSVDIDQLWAQGLRLEENIKQINYLICSGDGRGSDYPTTGCDELCGGAGCGRCGGGFSCKEGAVTRSLDALDISNRAFLNISILSSVADLSHKQLSDTTQQCADIVNNDLSDSSPDSTYSATRGLNSTVNRVLTELRDILSDITEFIVSSEHGENNMGTPSDIREVVSTTLSLKISLTPERIEQVASEIRSTVANLTNVEFIIKEANTRLAALELWKNRTAHTRTEAEKVYAMAKRVNESLTSATVSNNKSVDEISRTKAVIAELEDLLDTNVSPAMTESSSSKVLDGLKHRLAAVRERQTESEINVERAREEVRQAEPLSEQAVQDAENLSVRFENISATLESKYNETVLARSKVERLRVRAAGLLEKVFKYTDGTKDLNSRLLSVEQEFIQKTAEAERLMSDMSGLLTDIRGADHYHRTCS